jgi:hypothetical protein
MGPNAGWPVERPVSPNKDTKSIKGNNILLVLIVFVYATKSSQQRPIIVVKY